MKERPREKLARVGPKNLKDEELLALILRTGYKGKSVKILTSELLKKYPDRKLFEMPFGRLKRIKGVGVSRAGSIIAGYELAKRRLGKSSHVQIKNSEDVVAQVNEIRTKKKEHFVVLYLNARNELVHKEYISIGTLNASLVHPREVFAPALGHFAASVILTHNHPSDSSEPSADDRELTTRLVNGGKILGIDVLDHIIVSENKYFSFKENGLL